MANPKVKLKISFSDAGKIVGMLLPTAVALWPDVRAKLKGLKDEPEVAAFVASLEEIYRLATT
jgi:hypothetical protein